MCTDCAGAMLGKKKATSAMVFVQIVFGRCWGKKKGLKARLLYVAPHVNFTHCVIHKEALARNALDPERKSVLETAEKWSTA